MDKSTVMRIATYIKDNAELVEQNDWQQIYSNLNNLLPNKDKREIIPSLTQIANEFGVNPLDYLRFIPGFYSLGIGIESLAIPQNIETIGPWSFDSCKKLLSLDIPNKVIEIYKYAFARCSSLETVKLGNSLKAISAGVFLDCSNIKEITIPPSVTDIYEYAFEGCTSLKTVIFEKGSQLLKIKEGAFDGCTQLGEISIPTSLYKLRSEAFRNCKQLKKVFIPKDIEIEFNVFSGCQSLTDITYGGTTKEWGQEDRQWGWDKDTPDFTIHCTDGDLKKDW